MSKDDDQHHDPDPNLDLEPLPSDIAGLLEQEKNSYPIDEPMKAAVLARVELAVGVNDPSGGGEPTGGGGGGSGASSSGGGAGTRATEGGLTSAMMKAIGVSLLIGGVIGGVLVNRFSSNDASLKDAPIAVTPTTSSIIVSAAANDEAPSPAATAVTTATPAPSSASANGAEATPVGAAATGDAASDSNKPSKAQAGAQVGDLSRERELLDVARAALAHNRPNDALAATQEHARAWPRGYLVEEREVLWIRALALAGRRPDAEQKAAAFHRTFPNSLFKGAVDDAMRSIP